MIFRQIYLGCLAHASYFIASDGEAVVVDPQRDVDVYLQEAAAAGARIRYVLETHLHADFVSGHRELSERTEAEIVFGAAAEAELPHRAVRDGDELRVGSVVLRAIETPGHTPEGISWLVTDGSDVDAPVRLLSGDTLFIGDVGRPDLAGGRGFTPAQMAEMLYDSIHRKLLTLDDAVEVWPAHGAGSACGKNISKERNSTIGIQRRTNYALQPMGKEAFVAMMTADLPPAPRYFPIDAEINRHGARPLSELHAVTLDPESVREAIAGGAVVLDVRPPDRFAAAHLPGSINIGLDGQFASWAGTILDPGVPVVLVSGSEAERDEAVTRLARVGLENVRGAMSDDLDAWRTSGGELKAFSRIDVSELQARRSATTVVDVRRPAEYASGHVPGAINLSLADLEAQARDLAGMGPVTVICAGGYRSAIGASLLRRLGFDVHADVLGGTSAWSAAGYPLEA
jgi:hydroxyacylglutathione hydrolase